MAKLVRKALIETGMIAEDYLESGGSSKVSEPDIDIGLNFGGPGG